LPVAHWVFLAVSLMSASTFASPPGQETQVVGDEETSLVNESDEDSENLQEDSQVRMISIYSLRTFAFRTSFIGFCLVSLVLLASWQLWGVQDPPRPMTVERMLTSAEFVDEIAQQACATPNGCHAADVMKTMHGFMPALSERFPVFMTQLRTMEVTDQQREAVVKGVRHFKSTRMRALGSRVREVMHESESDSPAARKRHLVERLAPQHAELSALRNDVFSDLEFPESQANNPEAWMPMLGPDALTLTGNLGKWNASLTVSLPDGAAALSRRLAPTYYLGKFASHSALGVGLIWDLLTLVFSILHATGTLVLVQWIKIVITVLLSIQALAICVPGAVLGLLFATMVTGPDLKLLQLFGITCGIDVVWVAHEALLLFLPHMKL